MFGSRSSRPSAYRPRYLVKRVRLVLLFAILSAAAGFVQDPRFFGLLSAAARANAISTPMLLVGLAIGVLASFGFIRNILEPRYANPRQALAASVMFLCIFTAASLAGFALRTVFLEPAPARSLRVNELVVAAIVIALGASAMATIYNTLHVQKSDYMKLRSEIRTVLGTISAMAGTFERQGFVSGGDAARLADECRAARDSVTELLKIEAPAYAEYVEHAYAAPLRELTKAAEQESVAETPESFLRACGVLPGHPAHNETLNRAFHLLQNGS